MLLYFGMGVHQTAIGLKSLQNIKWDDKTVLDIGCGSGKLTEQVLEITNCSKIVGVDIDSNKIEKANKLAKENAKLSFSFADASDLSLFTAESFDIVFSNIAFQQFNNKAGFLKEVYRVLKPGGEAFVNFIEEKSEVKKEMEKIIINSPYKDKVKINPGKKISADEFSRLAKEAGFSQNKVISENNTYYYDSVDSLLDDYQRFEIIFPSLKDLPSEDLEDIWQKLREEFIARKTEKGFSETWKVAFGHLIK